MTMLKGKSSQHNAIETLATLAFASTTFGLIFELYGLFYVAVCLLFVGIFLKKLSVHMANIWLRFAAFLGGISTRIVLSVIFFVFLTPIALLYRLFHSDFISLKRKSAVETTYWKERNYEYSSRDLENPW